MSKFHAGDEVIVTEGVYGCAYNATKKMIDMIGSVVHISRAGRTGASVFYEIEEDSRMHIWCDRCFERYIDENETPISDEEFGEILDSIFEFGGSGV